MEIEKRISREGKGEDGSIDDNEYEFEMMSFIRHIYSSS